MASYLEHVNVTVDDLDETVRFLTTALPDFRVRHRHEDNGRVWMHVGNDTSYFALNGSLNPTESRRQELNHVGFVVDDVEAVRQRLRDAGYPSGYQDGEIIDHPFRRRVYFLDRDGNEYEFVQYLSDQPEQRNTYDD